MNQHIIYCVFISISLILCNCYLKMRQLIYLWKILEAIKGFSFLFVLVHSNVFFYPFHFLISHICTKVHFSNKKTISFHERLHVIIVNGCSIVNARNGWELTGIYLQCKIFKVLQKQLDREESPKPPLGGGTGVQHSLALQECVWAVQHLKTVIFCH